jgi:TPM domain
MHILRPAFLPGAALPSRRQGARATLTPLCAASRSTRPPPLSAALAAPRIAAAAALTAAALCTGLPAIAAPVVSPSALSRATPGAPVADLANVFGARQEERLAVRLAALEAGTGVRVRVLTQTTGSAPGAVIKEFFGLDEKSVLVVVDERGGNVLNFNVGAGVGKLLPESFWIELGNRYGNKFYVRDVGEDGAVLAAVDAIEKCVESGKVCRAVPGFGRDQYAVCVGTSVVGGVIAGAASRTGGKQFNAAWLALFSPLWGIFFGSFGLLPVVSREGWVNSDVAGVFAAFAAVAVATWAWVPTRFGPAGGEKTDADI